MKIKILTLTFLTISTFAQANPYYICSEKQSGKVIVQFNLKSDCPFEKVDCNGPAEVVFGDNQHIIGTYQQKKAACPSRLCGDYRLNINAKTSDFKWPYWHIQISINDIIATRFDYVVIEYYKDRSQRKIYKYDVVCESSK